MMHLINNQHDLTTDDGYIQKVIKKEKGCCEVEIHFSDIASNFVGYQIPANDVFFNLKSTLAQFGLEAITKHIDLKQSDQSAVAYVELVSFHPVAAKFIELITERLYIGKLFAKDRRRIVQNQDYLMRMFGRNDHLGHPLLGFGGLPGHDHLSLEKIDNRTVAFLQLEEGVCQYEEGTLEFLPTLIKALKHRSFKLRQMIRLHQKWLLEEKRVLTDGNILLVRTAPLHIRTVFGQVVPSLLPNGYHHTAASILEPDTCASGDIYELYGKSDKEITHVPLEFYTLEPYKEHVFFEDRDQLKSCLEDQKCIFDAFDTMPNQKETRASTFVVKGTQLLNLSEEDWVISKSVKESFPPELFSSRKTLQIERYIQQQSDYPFLKAMSQGTITSQGILLMKYFPTTLMKRMLLSEPIQRLVKGIYFMKPSQQSDDYFSHEDRSLLVDLTQHCIPVYWADTSSNLLLQYVPRTGKESGMFVPLKHIDDFRSATMIGVYGSNLLEGHFDVELKKLLHALKTEKHRFEHELLNKDTVLALVTGGGPGAMAIGNRVATELDILSCANVVDFRRASHDGYVHEQDQNPFIQAKMTYQLDKLVERQAEFHLDLPIFVIGGIGTDFEFLLEEVRLKVGAVDPHPILLFGEPSYWKAKIATRYQCNKEAGTTKGSEWVSNCFYAVRNAEEAMLIYRLYFGNLLPLGIDGPIYPNGFGTVEELKKVVKTRTMHEC